MTTRKILSLSATYDGYIFPDLPIQERPKIGVTTVTSSQLFFDENGNLVDEKIIETEHDVFDENWKPEDPSIYLITKEGKKYYSIDSRYTLTKLKSTFNPNLDEEFLFNLELHSTSSLDSGFTDEILDHNLLILNKYKEDNDYLNYLGLPNPTDSDKYLLGDTTVGIAST
jgi:hypothetical protein